MSAALTRRAALSGAVASVALVGAAAAATMPLPSNCPTFAKLMTDSRAAEQRFNTLRSDLEAHDPDAFRAEVDRMIGAAQRADAAVPMTWREYAELFEHMVDGGNSALSEVNADRLLAHARRLAKMEG